MTGPASPPEAAQGGEPRPELPVDPGAGPPSAASTLADGLRLAWDHAPLLLAIVLPYSLLAMGLYAAIYLFAAPGPPDAVGMPDVGAILLRTALPWMLVLTVGCWTWSALDVALDRLIDSQPISPRMAFAVGLRRIRLLPVATLIIPMAIGVLAMYSLVAVTFLVAGGLAVSGAEPGVAVRSAAQVAVVVTGLVMLVPLCISLRLAFFTEFIVLGGATLGFGSSWRRTAGRGRLVAGTLLPPWLLPYLLVSIPMIAVWLTGRSQDPVWQAAAGVVGMVAMLYTPFAVAVRVLLWRRLGATPGES